MKKLLPYFCLLSLSALTSVSALAESVVKESGGWTSSGGDYRSFASGSAWFLGTEAITVCAEINPEFGKSQAEVQEIFGQAVRTWKEYLTTKHISTTLNGNYPGLELNLNYRFLANCDGQEDLKLYLGVENPEVLAEKAHYEKPYAFVVRKSFDMLSGRGKGFLWFAQTGSVFPLAGKGFPNWNNPSTLLGMMLHELGHVLGCGHVEHTIMQADMMSSLQFMDGSTFSERGAAILSRIDDIQLLYHSPYAPFDYNGYITHGGYRPEEAAATFEYVMGRKPQGTISTRYYRAAYDAPRYLEIRDDKSTERFLVTAVANSDSTYSDENEIFHAAMSTGLTDGKTAVGTSFHKSGFTQLGWIEGKGKEKRISLLISENMDDLSRPFYLRYLKGGEALDLFNTRLPGM